MQLNGKVDWKRDGVDKQVYQQFNDAALLANKPARTVRTALLTPKARVLTETDMEQRW
jgi:hypothetical protein